VRTRWKLTSVGAACLLAVTAAMAQIDQGSSGNAAQTQEFEVAAIREHPPGDGSSSIMMPPGRYEATNVTVKTLIEEAYNVPADQISGGPPWLEKQRFDVSAKISDESWEQIRKLRSTDQEEPIHGMLQALLQDRFQLILSHQPRELRVYALVQARGGAKLRPHGARKLNGGEEEPRGADSGSSYMMATQLDVPVTELANFLAAHMGRTVLDQTGLEGRFDIELKVAVPPDSRPDGVDTALFQALDDQLGLKLVSRTATVDTIRVDRLEEPSEN
jgi:uncharacterized protein (TIGR03435 family)